MNKLEKAKEVIKKSLPLALHGIYNTRNTLGDPLVNLCDEEGLRIDVCVVWSYFEVFGLSDEEFTELEKYYIEEKLKDSEE